MPRSAKHLLIGSTEAYSGKSAAILGLAFQLQEMGIDIAYGKPLGSALNGASTHLDADVKFITQTLNLSPERVRPTLFCLDEATVEKQLLVETRTDYRQILEYYQPDQGGDLVLLEGPGTLEEGSLFGLSLPQLAEAIDASVVLTARYHSLLVVDGLLAAKQQLGDRLLGVLINDVVPDQISEVEANVKPYLERHDIPVLAILPRIALMRSVSVKELVNQLTAEVLCCEDRLDLMVESLTIGAMNVNSALKYFRKAKNMAVVTGGDRTDIQLAALETSTQCLILTGHLPPSPEIINRATDLEVPILSVDLDTLTTVEIIDQTFGQVRLHEPIKVQCIQELMKQHFDMERLITALELEPLGTAPKS